jgi:hypothetical protein
MRRFEQLSYEEVNTLKNSVIIALTFSTVRPTELQPLLIELKSELDLRG